MSEQPPIPPEIIYEITEEAEYTDAEKLMRLAELKASTLLRTWRSRFVDGRDDARPVSAMYPQTDGQISLDSPDAQHVRAVHKTAEGAELTYSFGRDAEGSQLEIAGLSEADAPSSDLVAYERFSRLLFDCDNLQARG